VMAPAIIPKPLRLQKPAVSTRPRSPQHDQMG
jgi:hypothetical protein